MKGFRKKLAIFMVLLIMVPSLPVKAEEEPASQIMLKTSQEDGDGELDNPLDTQEKQLDEDIEETEEPNGTSVPAFPDGKEMQEETEPVKPTKEPEPIMDPEASTVPEVTLFPEVSSPLDTTVFPEATSSSMVSPSPEIIQDPEVSSLPEATVSPIMSATPDVFPLSEAVEADEILFNTGNHKWSVVSREAFEQEKGDGYYEEDGSYTINIPEVNPFFPYEIQFTCNGEVTNQWFMTPDDNVEIGGHIFYVSAYFDNTAITQMALNVAGDTVIVWPEEKEFTDEDEGQISELSLLPLTEKNLTVDLSNYTPVELTMISASSIFTGTEELRDTDKIVWTYNDDDEYTISESGDRLDLSYHTGNGTLTAWQMIVGEADQLAADNTRYTVQIKVSESRNWLIPEMYYLDDSGNRLPITILESAYFDNDKDRRTLNILTQFEEGRDFPPYLKLKVNPSVFGSTVYDHFKVYDGKFVTAEEAIAGNDITDMICGNDWNSHSSVREWITMVTFDGNGSATGCLPIYIYNPWRVENYYDLDLFEGTGDGRRDAAGTWNVQFLDYIRYCTCTLKTGFKADAMYYLDASWYGGDGSDSIMAAYVGLYSSQGEAVLAGAADIKDTLFDGGSKRGYAADFSKGVYFTIFQKISGADGYSRVVTDQIFIKTEEEENPAFSSGTSVWFSGLRDSSGRDISSYVFPSDGDSYGENNYLTILAGADVDLTRLAPVFSTETGIHLYAAGSITPEVSGGSVHDFSGGPVQYTASAEDGTNAKNYWLQVVKESTGIGQLYINSLGDVDADTRIENGIVYSKREMMLDGYHNYIHDIWLANIGTEAIPALSAEILSDVVELDDYWTLNGNFELQGFITTSKDPGNKEGELPNLAKIRITAKEGVANGTDVSGILRIKSAGDTLMELTLTGTVGDPRIITEKIPEAVKYVPYGSVIQNNNKYSWNRGKYSLVEGVLPAGMEIRPNGELYGVPSETGEFTFTVRMDNSFEGFVSDVRSYTLKVIDNTDANVDAATDAGYELIQRVQNLSLSVGSGEVSADKRTLVSQGLYDEFIDIYLDGVKLEEETDYGSEPGSTRITILTQTLARNGAGTHTLGVEFRTSDTDTLKRAAQNYKVDFFGNDSNSGGNGNSGSDNSRNDSNEGDTGDESGNEPGNNGLSVGNTAMVSRDNGDERNTAEPSKGTDRTIVYTVEKGDSLWKIAEKFYGSGTYWRKLYEDNADIIHDPDRIYAGQEIIIYLTQEASSAGEGTYYTVEAGDTLWKIARKLYGRGWRWRRIYEANTDKIKNPEYIYAGQVLFIPE